MNLKMTHTIQLFHQQEASLIYVLSLHRKHSWKTNFEAEHVVANVWSVVLFG